MYELTMNLNPKSKTPLYEQIYEFIKEEIQNNVIQSGGAASIYKGIE